MLNIPYRLEISDDRLLALSPVDDPMDVHDEGGRQVVAVPAMCDTDRRNVETATIRRLENEVLGPMRDALTASGYLESGVSAGVALPDFHALEDH